MSDHLHELVHTRATEIDLEYYESARYHDTLHRAQQEGAYRPTRIVNGLVQVAQSSLALLLMAGVLVSFHWATAIVLFAAAVPGVLLRLRHARRSYDSQQSQTQAERRGQYYHAMLTGTAHAKELRLFGLGPLFRQRHRDLRREITRHRLQLASWRFRSDLVTQGAATLAVFGTFAFIIYRASLGALTIGDVVMYYQAFQRGQDFLREILGGLAGLYEDHLFLASLYEFLDLERKVVEPAAAPTAAPSSPRGHRVHRSELSIPVGAAEGAPRHHADHRAGRARGARGSQRLRQDHPRQAPVPAVRPDERRHYRGRRRPPGSRDHGAPARDLRALPGLGGLPRECPRQHLVRRSSAGDRR